MSLVDEESASGASEQKARGTDTEKQQGDCGVAGGQMIGTVLLHMSGDGRGLEAHGLAVWRGYYQL